ncbi:MAG: hypothetical protein KAT58_03545 [candidate division Zixibacteria bacterium]|nr:hypothetical protein [candidate division Zixibacteria bacterium]
MSDKNETLKGEIEALEKEYEIAQARSMFDKKQADHLYKRLKKKRKELKELEEK